MRFKRRAAATPRNQFGKPIRRVLPYQEWVGRDDEDVANLIDMGYLPQMAGATSPTNQALNQPLYFPAAVIVTTDQTINQGDAVWWDAVNYTLKPCTTSAAVAVGTTGGFCGCAAGTVAPNVYPNPAAGTPSENLPGIVVQSGGSVSLFLQSNDVVDYPFQAVTMAGVDAQTITRGTASSTNRVGFAIVHAPVTPNPAAGTTPTTTTIAGGQRIKVWLERKYPTTACI